MDPLGKTDPLGEMDPLGETDPPRHSPRRFRFAYIIYLNWANVIANTYA